MTDAETAMARRMRLGQTDMAAMTHLASARQAVGPSWLSARLGLTPAAATELVDRLEKVGHLTRVRDRTDRRRVNLIPTASTLIEVNDHLRPLLDAVDAVAEEFTDEERAAIRRFLAQVSAIYDDFASGNVSLSAGGICSGFVGSARSIDRAEPTNPSSSAAEGRSRRGLSRSGTPHRRNEFRRVPAVHVEGALSAEEWNRVQDSVPVVGADHPDLDLQVCGMSECAGGECDVARQFSVRRQVRKPVHRVGGHQALEDAPGGRHSGELGVSGATPNSSVFR